MLAAADLRIDARTLGRASFVAHAPGEGRGAPIKPWLFGFAFRVALAHKRRDFFEIGAACLLIAAGAALLGCGGGRDARELGGDEQPLTSDIEASPFQVACTGAPLTETAARAWLDAAGSDDVALGTFTMAFRTKEYVWYPDRSKWYYDTVRWLDAPGEAFVAWRETGVATSSGQKAVLPRTGALHLARDAAGAPYVRLVGDAAHLDGPDTTQLVRLVSSRIRPWAARGGPSFDLETSTGGGAWAPFPEYGWSVEMKSRSPGHSGQIWFVGGEGMVSFMTPDRAQLISSQPTGMTAATDTAVALFVAFR